MKKLLMTIITTFLLTLSGSFCYATGSEGAISQMELTDYVIIAGAIIFLIGMALILLALFLNTSRKKDVDEEYDDALDDINIIDEDDLAEEPAEEITDVEEASDEPAEEDTSDEDVLDIAEEVSAEDEPLEATEEPAIEETEQATDEAEAIEEAEEADQPEEASEPVIEEAEETPVKSIRLTLSGTNNPDLKIIDVTDTVTAGRRSTNDLLISDSAVSGEHCKFIYDGEALFIEDLNSTNGTFLNGEQIEKAEIKTGDTIILGQKQYRVTIS